MGARSSSRHEAIKVRSRKTGYSVIVSTRNGASTIKETVTSILRQTIPPAQICVVNDGSTDDTADILNALGRWNGLRIVTLPDRGYDIRRVPANLNLAYASLDSDFDYLLISGDDCVYPKEYARLLLSRMASHQRIVVASGVPRTGGTVLREHSPSGSGRMIKHSFWRAVGESYPMSAGWETWLLYKALEKGFAIKLCGDLIYEHLRPRGSMHQLAYWGSAMYCLGYHPLYSLGRVAKNLVKMEITLAGSVNMLRGYLLAFFGSSDPFISTFEQPVRDFVRAQQAGRIVDVASTLMSELRGVLFLGR